MKKLLIGIALISGMIVTGVLGYRLISPEITVANVSGATIEELMIRLPSNRVVFGELRPGAESTIYYSASQSDGTYDYSVKFPNKPILSGSCGHVTNSEHGKRFQLVVLGPDDVECRESNKVF